MAMSSSMLLHLLKTLKDVAESTSVVLSEGDSIRNVYEFTEYSCIHCVLCCVWLENSLYR